MASSGQGSGHSLEALACVSCRSKKLKCDRTKPTCARCIKSQNECVYPESRRKPTFKRRNVRELEARLAQVEEFLKEVNGKSPDDDPTEFTAPHGASIAEDDDEEVVVVGEETMGSFNFNQPLAPEQPASQPSLGQRTQPQADMPSFQTGESSGNWYDGSGGGDGQLMDLGMSEALPPFEVMEDLNNIFFENHHFYLPLLHHARYLSHFYGSPLLRPPMGLQYIIWAMAAIGNEKYNSLTDVYYRRARHYAEQDEMKGDGEFHVTLRHAQMWCVIATYEAKRMLYTRASLSVAKAVRLANMLGLERMDDPEPFQEPAMDPPPTWIEMEERRRALWGAFSIDAHARISTGMPSLMRDCDIKTRLPCSEEAFLLGTPEDAPFLDELFDGSPFSGFSGTILICQVFKLVMDHVHSNVKRDNPQDMEKGGFWIRHGDLDNKLSRLFMFLPEKLRLPQSSRDPNAVHTNLNLHASVICLHHAVIEQVNKYGHPASVKDNSVARIKTAAEEIVNIIKMVAHSVTIFKSPLTAMSMYCATTVFVYLAKVNPQGFSTTDKANLELVINAMEAVGRNHDITRAFLRQASVDIERNGLDGTLYIPTLQKYRDMAWTKKSHIPMFVRSATQWQAEQDPTGSGLNKTRSAAQGPSFSRESAEKPVEQSRIFADGGDCFQPILGPANRNILTGVPSTWQPSSADFAATQTFQTGAAGDSLNSTSAGKNGFWGGVHPSFGATLPDRTTPSSASSPLNRTGGTDSISKSSHTSPGTGPTGAGSGTGTGTGSGSIFMASSSGLGNSAEENRVDLRELQGRVLTPLWATNAAGDDMFGRLTETVIGGDLPDRPDFYSFMQSSGMDWGTTETGQQRQQN